MKQTIIQYFFESYIFNSLLQLINLPLLCPFCISRVLISWHISITDLVRKMIFPGIFFQLIKLERIFIYCGSYSWGCKMTLAGHSHFSSVWRRGNIIKKSLLTAEEDFGIQTWIGIEIEIAMTSLVYKLSCQRHLQIYRHTPML